MNGKKRPQSIILIFGLPDSGTTWLGKIFDSHPETLYRHEPDRYPLLEALPMFPSASEAGAYADVIFDFVAELPYRSDLWTVGKMPLFRKTWRNPLRHRLLKAAVLAAKLGAKTGINFPVPGARADKIIPPPTIVWKSIESLGRFGLLMQSLPHARGIHIVRHPCARVNSWLREHQTGQLKNAANSYDLYKKLLRTFPAQRQGLTIRDFHSMKPEERLAWYWVLSNEHARDEASKSGRTRFLRYEDLCTDPIATSRHLFSFAGLDWNMQVAEFIKESTQKHVEGRFSIYKNPRYTAFRWRNELSPEIIENVLKILKNSSLSELYPE